MNRRIAIVHKRTFPMCECCQCGNVANGQCCQRPMGMGTRKTRQATCAATSRLSDLRLSHVGSACRTSPVACLPIFPPPRWRLSQLGGRAGARPSQRERCHGVCGCGSHATGHWIVPPSTVEIESGSRHPLANPCGTLR